MACTYCDCCPTVADHVAQHYDPEGLTCRYDNAEEVLAIFRGCFAGEGPCPLTVEDVHAYLAWLEDTEAH